jgi:hypothetical protein
LWNGAVIMESSRAVPQKIKKILYDSAILLSGIHLTEQEGRDLNMYLYPQVHSGIIPNCQKVDVGSPSMDFVLDKQSTV